MCCGPACETRPGSRSMIPARATKPRTASAPRSATHTSPGSAPPAQRAAATSSNCCAPAMAITSSMPKPWPICAHARSPGPSSPAWPSMPIDVFADQAAWNAHLDRLGISALKVNPDPCTIATEGALWGSIKAHGFLPDTVIVSDDAGQFNVGQHGLCWVHAERLVHKLDTFTDAAASRPAPRSRADLVVLPRSQGLSPKSDHRAQAPPCAPASIASSPAAPASSPSTVCSPGSMPTSASC